MAPSRQDVIALRRFGLGLRPGDLGRIEDPRGAILAEIEARCPPAVDPPEPASHAAIAEAFHAFQEAQAAARAAAPPPALAVPPIPAPNLAPILAPIPAPIPAPPVAVPPASPPAAVAMAGPAGAAMEPALPQRLFRQETSARFAAALAAPIGFGERLAQFWSNHFCVSVAKGQMLRAFAGVFEREAIRPHVFGRFEDMLLAVESHPAMLAYLDNGQSIGPNSPAGARRGRGLNENLAREILELHTLGVRSGYTQADVTSLARIITGWTVAGRAAQLGPAGSFVFNARAHEPGAHRLLGATYADAGVEQGRAALRALAAHPATSDHIAAKLARAFVGEAAPAALIARLAANFRETRGDLAALARVLITSEAAWDAPPARLSTPQEFFIAAARALGRKLEFGQIAGPLAAMGQPVWQPPGPDGFSSADAAWATSEGVRTRIELAAAWGRQSGATVDARALAEDVLGPALTAATRQAVARAESRPQAIALLLMSPDFQRR